MNISLRVYPGSFTRGYLDNFIIDLVPVGYSSYMLSVIKLDGTTIVAHGRTGGISADSQCNGSFELSVPKPPDENSKDYSQQTLRDGRVYNVTNPNLPKRKPKPHTVTWSYSPVEWKGKKCEKKQFCNCPDLTQRCECIPIMEIFKLDVSISI